MEMRDSQATLRPAITLLLLQTIRERTNWYGETKVQECLFFLQETQNVPLGFRFILYGHGPFSFDLRELLGELRANALIDLRIGSPLGPSLDVAPIGTRLLERHAHLCAPYADAVARVVGVLAGYGMPELERLSTSLYVAQRHGELSASARARLVVDLKPHIPEDEANAAMHQIDQLIGAVANRAMPPTVDAIR